MSSTNMKPDITQINLLIRLIGQIRDLDNYAMSIPPSMRMT